MDSTTDGTWASADSELTQPDILNDDRLLQQTQRTRDEHGEAQTGYYRCYFEPGQQRYALHVTIHPAMLERPTVETMVLNRDDVRVRVTDRQKYGLRIELILASPSETGSEAIAEVIAYSSHSTDQA